MIKSRLTPLQEPKNEEERKIQAVAKQLAQAEHRAMIVDDLRHAVHVVALGVDVSHADLTNAQWDRVRNLFRLLVNELDIDARLNFENPQNEERKRLLWCMENHFHARYAATVCNSKFGTPDWHSLEIEPLRHLVQTLRHRPNARKGQGQGTRRSALKPENVKEEDPF
jgi:hypothetical protein